MPEIVKAESHLLPFLDHAGFHCRRSEVLLYHDGRRQRFLALETRTLGNTKSVSLPKGVLSRHARRNPAKRGCMGTGAFDVMLVGCRSIKTEKSFARATIYSAACIG